MTFKVVSNALQGQSFPRIPHKDNGDFFEYMMTYESNRYIVYAETLPEVINCLISGYAEMSDDDQILARISLAMSIQTQAQGYLISTLTDEQVSALASWEYQVMVHEGTSSPHSWGHQAQEKVEESSGESIDIWYSSIPLVLIDTGYAPFTDIPRPLSSLGASKQEKNLLWLEPSDETLFLESLERVGFIYFARRAHKK